MSIVPQIIINSIIAGSLYALVAMGFSLIYSVTKFFNLAHGVLAAVGGYGVFFFGRMLGLPVMVAVALGILIATLVGWLLERCVFSPLRSRKSSALVLLVASLGAFTAIQALIALLFGSQFLTLAPILEGGSPFTVAGATITDVQIVLVGTALAAFVCVWLILKKTSFGKVVRATADDEEVAKIVGINTHKVIGKTFVIGSMLAGMAGILSGFDTGIEPIMGLPLLLKGVIAAIIGGMGSVPGALLGAYLLGFSENVGVWFIPGEWKDAISFSILILFLLLRPFGILGRK